MPALQHSQLSQQPLTGADGKHSFGIELSGIDLSRPDDALLGQLAQLWSEQPLVLIRDQLLNEQSLMQLSEHFGELEAVVRKDIHSASNPEVALISNLYREDGSNIGGLGNDELRWHTDQSYRERPATGAIFFAIEIPPSGGNTRWINTQMAYDALPQNVQERIENAYGLFAYAMYSTDITSQSESRSIRQLTPDARHPLVLRHPVSGRRSLYFDPTQTYDIDGMEPAQATQLIQQLTAHLQQPQFMQTHQWRMGDVMMWDNARLLHSREAFDPRFPRLAKRTTIFLRQELFPVPATG